MQYGPRTQPLSLSDVDRSVQCRSCLSVRHSQLSQWNEQSSTSTGCFCRCWRHFIHFSLECQSPGDALTAGPDEGLLGPLPHLSPFTLQPIRQQQKLMLTYVKYQYMSVSNKKNGPGKSCILSTNALVLSTEKSLFNQAYISNKTQPHHFILVLLGSALKSDQISRMMIKSKHMSILHYTKNKLNNIQLFFFAIVSRCEHFK